MTREAELRMKLHQLILNAMRMSGWQISYESAVAFVKREYLRRTFNVETSTALSDEELSLAISHWRTHATVAPPTIDFFKAPSQQMVRKVIAIGKYSLASTYGPDWYIKKIAEFSEESYKHVDHPDIKPRTCKRVGDLTEWEAKYVIMRLERIEERVARARS